MSCRVRFPAPEPPPAINANIVAVLRGDEDHSTVNIDLDMPVSLDAGFIPQFVDDNLGLPPIGAAVSGVSPIGTISVTLTYVTDLPDSSNIIVPAEDPALRTPTGGFVNPGTFAVTLP